MLSIERIPCVQNGSVSVYELDPKQFGESIFKMCTNCKTFEHDFSELVCDCCKNNLDFINVSDVELLRKLLDVFSLNQKEETTNENGESHEKEMFMDETHDCAESIDCIDCVEERWDNTDYDSEERYQTVSVYVYDEYDESERSDDEELDSDCDCDSDSVS